MRQGKHNNGRRLTRHHASFALLVAAAAALALLALPAGRLKSHLDQPLASALQIFSLDAFADGASLMRLFSQVDEAEREAKLQEELRAALERELSGPAQLVTRAVATIVVRGSRTAPGAERADHVRPTTPQGVAVSTASDTSLEVSWSPSLDDDAVLAYEVIREGTAPFTATDTRLVDSGLQPGATHCYTVLAMDRAGNRSDASARACGVTNDVVAPTAPSSIRAAIAGKDVFVSWTASSDDSSSVAYEIWSDDALLATVDVTSWTHSGPPARPRHCYSVRAVDGHRNASQYSGIACVNARDVTPPTAPQDVALEPVSPTQIGVSWSASSDDVGVARYEVLTGGAVRVQGTTTAAQVINLAEDEEHCFTVRAVDTAGNRSESSAQVCGRTLSWDDMPEWKRRHLAGKRIGVR